MNPVFRRVLAFALLSAACAGVLAQTTLKVVMHSDLKALDPLVSTQYISRNHGYMIWDQLIAQDEKGQVRPQMADKWTVSADGTVYTFTLRDGLEWHDGSPVTSEDCMASIRRFMQRDPSGLRLAPFVKGMESTDARTFRLILKEPYGMVLETLSKPSLSPMLIMPRRVAETPASEPIGPDKMIGSGPFILKRDEWKPGEKVVYVKNPRYRPRSEPASGFAGGKVVQVDRVEWLAIPDAQTAVTALTRGEIDMVEVVPADLLPLVEKGNRLRVQTFSAGQYFGRMNWAAPPFDNPKVRQALMVAVNQEQTLKGSVGDVRFYKVCKSIYICGGPLASDAGTAGLYQGNARRAQQMLTEAGYDGTPVVIPYPTDLPPLAALGPLAKQQLERAGFKVQLVAMDWQSMGPRLRKKDKGTEGGWSYFMSLYDARDAQDPIARTVLNADCKTSFLGWPCDQKFESLRDAYTRATSTEARKDIARQIQERNHETGVLVPLGEARFMGAMDRRLEHTFKQPITVFWGVKKG
jgi:peptide/nickel transport system substrate-binding protein